MPGGLGPSALASWSLPLGAALDALLGDPRGWPHPVRAIGVLIVVAERILRAGIARLGGGPRLERMAGVVLAATVVGSVGAIAFLLVAAVDRLGPYPSLAGRSLLVYWGLATRSLGVEARRASDEPDLVIARRELSWIVGRDTEALERPEICRACVETIAENTGDAVVAPLFWFAAAGPIGLWAFKAINTLDSMVGYRNPRYLHFGRASAKLDDLACLVPARLTWLLIAAASAIAGERGRAALRIGWRDGRNHPSPNAAWGEAAMAGALGVELGGPATYRGIPGTKPGLGDPGPPIDPATVRRAVRILNVAAALALALAWGARGLADHLSHPSTGP